MGIFSPILTLFIMSFPKDKTPAQKTNKQITVSNVSRSINSNQFFLIAVPLFTGLMINSTTIKIYHIKKKKKLSISRSGVDRWTKLRRAVHVKHADGTVHASTKSQPSSPHPPRSEIWTAKVLSAGMREGTAQSFSFQYLKSSYKYRPYDLLTHS